MNKHFSHYIMLLLNINVGLLIKEWIFNYFLEYYHVCTFITKDEFTSKSSKYNNALVQQVWNANERDV